MVKFEIHDQVKNQNSILNISYNKGDIGNSETLNA